MPKILGADYLVLTAFIGLSILLRIYSRQSDLTEQSFLFIALSLIFAVAGPFLPRFVGWGTGTDTVLKLTLLYVVTCLIVFGTHFPKVAYVAIMAILSVAYHAGRMLGVALSRLKH